MVYDRFEVELQSYTDVNIRRGDNKYSDKQN